MNNTGKKIENAHSARALRNDELDVVSGGFSWGMTQTSTAVLAAPRPTSFYELLISQ